MPCQGGTRSPGLTPHRSAAAGARAISRPCGRADSASGAKRKRPTNGHAASVPRRSTSTAGVPTPVLIIPRIDTVSETRPACANAASSATVARRWDTVNSTSPPRIWRPFASSAAIMLAARLPIPASAAVPRNRQATNSTRPRPPRRTSRNANRKKTLTHSADRSRYDRPRASRPGRSAQPGRDRA